MGDNNSDSNNFLVFFSSVEQTNKSVHGKCIAYIICFVVFKIED